jgi:hypothetical protein
LALFVVHSVDAAMGNVTAIRRSTDIADSARPDIIVQDERRYKWNLKTEEFKSDETSTRIQIRPVVRRHRHVTKSNK